MKVTYSYEPLGVREYTDLEVINIDIQFLESLIAKLIECNLDAVKDDLKLALKAREAFKKEHDL